MNPTGDPNDDRVYINPTLTEAADEDEAEEGCLSMPGINVNVTRSKSITLHAHDLSGNPVVQSESGYVARIWQHEIDHLNGVLITDRVGPGTKLMLKRQLRELEDAYAAKHPSKPSKTAARPAKKRAGARR